MRAMVRTHAASARADAAKLQVLETVLVAVLVLSAVAYAVTVGHESRSGASPHANAMSALSESARSALLVLVELPPGSEPRAFGNLLEEYVTRGLRGDCAPLEGKLAGYFPPGVHYTVTLEKGAGAPRVVCEHGTVEDGVTGPNVATGVLVSPRWSRLHVHANVSTVSGVVPLDAAGNPTDADANPLELAGVLVLNSYVDTRAPLALAFENAPHGPAGAAFPDRGGIRYSGRVTPEFVQSGPPSYVPGYATPYDTTSTWDAYKASTLDLTQPVAAFGVAHPEAAVPAFREDVYLVHPKFTLSSVLSDLVRGMEPADRFASGSASAGAFAADAPGVDKALGETVTFRYDYSTLVRDTANVFELTSGRLTVHDPVGALATAAMPVQSLNGTKSWTIPQDALWGSYVAELRFALEDTRSGDVYLVHQLTWFNVSPPEWADKPKLVNPSYRVVLTAGYEHWVP